MDRLEYKMAGTPMIQHVSLWRRRTVPDFNLCCVHRILPLIQTRETSKLDSKQENQSNEQQVRVSGL